MKDILDFNFAYRNLRDMKLPLQDKSFLILLTAAILVVLLEIASAFGYAIPSPYSIIIYSIFIIGIGYKIILGAFKALSKANFSSVSLLMLLAIIGAYYLGDYSEAACVMVLYVLGEELEDIGMDNSKSALEALVNKAPKQALLKSSNTLLAIDKVAVGEVVVVKAGDMIPLDGVIISGNSNIDEAAITGEPLAKSKKEGDEVYAGTLNKEGYIEIKTTKLSQDSTFSKILTLTFQANANKSERQKFIQRFAKFYTPSILVLALLTFLVPVFLFHKDVDSSLKMAISLLVISCPCALILSTPVAVYAAIGNASAKGAIIKGGKFVEALADIKAFALDKTRTVTFGKPVVTDVVLLNGTEHEELIACTAGAESLSEHPLAKAVVDRAFEEGYTPHAVTDYKTVSGKGATAKCLVCEDEVISAGTLDFIGEKETIREEERQIVSNLSKEGKSCIVVSFGKGVAGVLGLADEIKPDSAVAIHELRDLGVESIMLTGDSQSAANFVSKQVGITEAKGGLLPEGKSVEMDRLMKKYQFVGMVGDGINDAPSLAKSTVGIAMGAVGSDIAIETADIALMNDNLRLLPYLIRLGRKTVSQIKFNIFFAVLVKLLFIILALVGHPKLFFAIFADVGVTLIVVLLSLRIAKFK